MKYLRFFQADILYPVHVPPIPQGIVVVNAENKIVDVIDPAKVDYNIQDIIKYSGSILPGFINTHCHLELSYLENQIQKKSGFGNFLETMIQERKKEKDEKKIKEKIREAISRSKSNGIVAIGDICNGLDSFGEKKSEKEITFVNFIEIVGISQKNNEELLENAKKMKRQFSQVGRSYIVPHSLYSVNTCLLKNIGDLQEGISTIHHYETEEEALFLREKRGEIKTVYEKNTIRFSDIVHQNTLPYLEHAKTGNKLLVHNGYMPLEIEKEIAQTKNIFLCICPRSNKYVTGKFPNVSKLSKSECILTLGTDSLATNTNFDIVSEIKTIKNEWKESTFDELVKWATLNSAKALGIDSQFGSFEKEKTPGGLQVENFEETEKNHSVKRVF